MELAGGFQPDYLTDCIILERLSPIGRELIPVLYEKNYLGTAVRNFDVIKIYPNSSILPKYFCLDTPQNKALSLNNNGFVIRQNGVFLWKLFPVFNDNTLIQGDSN